jgi:Protein of unknown function (DUF3105)
MAKKKRKHPIGPGPARSAGQPASKPSGAPGPSGRATATVSGPQAPPVRVQPAEPGGPNRQARKEEARRQREAIRRRQARRRFYRIGVVVLAVLVAAAAITLVAVRSHKSTTKVLATAGCGAVQTTQAYSGGLDRAHIGSQGANGTVQTAPALSTYPSRPPASGPHDGTPEDAGVYTDPPPVYKTIHSLEHGAVVIWYSPTAPASLVGQLTSYFNSLNDDHIIVAPFNYPDQGAAGKLPAGKQMVMVAWHHIQACGKVSVDAAKTFVHTWKNSSSAPEAGASI